MEETNGSTLTRHERNYPNSLLKRSLLFRPLPQGKKVYLVLVQFILLNIIEAFSELYFQVLLVLYCGMEGTKALPIFISIKSLPLLLCLPMGFIADRCFGRAKVLYYSWILLFVMQCAIAFYLSIVYMHNPTGKEHLQYVIVLIISLLGNSIGLAGVRVNLIPFGVDQMGAASSDQLSSYFHWYYWSRNAGIFIAYSIGIFSIPKLYSLYIVILLLLVPCVAAAAGSIINICGDAWFVKKEKVGNPLLMIYRVLSYALSVRRPMHRSAFSYDGRPKPSRIDLAKETHFGKFRDEQVEDVKTFLRILLMLISLVGFLCVYGLVSIVVAR